jgi:hypothetical protein
VVGYGGFSPTDPWCFGSDEPRLSSMPFAAGNRKLYPDEQQPRIVRIEAI